MGWVTITHVLYVFSKAILIFPGTFSDLVSSAPPVSIHFCLTVFCWLRLFHHLLIEFPHSFPHSFPIVFPFFSQEPPVLLPFFSQKNRPVPRSARGEAARLNRAGTVELLLDSNDAMVDARCGRREQFLAEWNWEQLPSDN